MAEDDRLQLQIAGRVPPQFAADYGSTDAAESPDFHGRRTWGVLKG